MCLSCLLKAKKEYLLCLSFVCTLMVTSSFSLFFEVWLLQSACDCKYGLSSEGQNDVGVWSKIGNVTLCSDCRMNSYRAPTRRHDRSVPAEGVRRQRSETDEERRPLQA